MHAKKIFEYSSSSGFAEASLKRPETLHTAHTIVPLLHSSSFATSLPRAGFLSSLTRFWVTFLLFLLPLRISMVNGNRTANGSVRIVWLRFLYQFSKVQTASIGDNLCLSQVKLTEILEQPIGVSNRDLLFPTCM